MNAQDPRIDNYIAKAQPFAQEILLYLRALIHEVCPEVEETTKWSFPHFVYKGEILCSMAAFKKHCAFGFWKAALMKDPALLENAAAETAMGHLGRITALEDLPSRAKLSAYIQEAMYLNEKGIKVPKQANQDKKPVEVPEFFKERLEHHPDALATFETFSYSNRKEYIEWITEAKTEATRERRIQTALEWLAEGKERNWKYKK